MSLSAYARHRGCHLNAVQVAVLNGRIVRDENGLIDSDAADRDWQETLIAGSRPGPKPARMKPAGDGDVAVLEAVPGISLMQARTLREVYSAQRTKLDIEVREKKYVLREEVEAEAFRLFRLLRDACFGLPPRLASQLAAETDAHTVHRMLEDEIHAVFAGFAQGKL